jgi:GAF domain-containing protein
MHDALGFLNGRTRYRFTGIYRCDPPALVIRSLYDRENPMLEHSGEIRELDGTFCSIVVATGRPFSTRDAPVDPLTLGYRVRREVTSYCGVPIRMRSGQVAGVLCHYDLRLRLPPEGEVTVLESVAPYLAEYVQRKEPDQISAPERA